MQIRADKAREWENVSRFGKGVARPRRDPPIATATATDLLRLAWDVGQSICSASGHSNFIGTGHTVRTI